MINKDQVQEVAGKIIRQRMFSRSKATCINKNLGELQARFGDVKEKIKDSQKSS